MNLKAYVVRPLTSIRLLSEPLDQSAIFAHQGGPRFVEPVEVDKGRAGGVQESFLFAKRLSLTMRAPNLDAACLVARWFIGFREAFGSRFKGASQFFHDRDIEAWCDFAAEEQSRGRTRRSRQG